MRTTIQRLVEVSKHRTGRALGFSALRAHKSGGQGSEPEHASAASAKAPAPPPPPGAHPPCVHADLQEQEAARRVTARASLAEATSTSSSVHRVRRDLVMTDASGATSARQDAGNSSGGGVPDAVTVADAMGRDAKQEKRVLLKDLLFVLEREVFAHGLWAAHGTCVAEGTCAWPVSLAFFLSLAYTSIGLASLASQLSVGYTRSQSAVAHGSRPRLGHRTLILCDDDGSGLSPFYWRC
jgi:hypothetical protein